METKMNMFVKMRRLCASSCFYFLGLW